MSDQDRLNRMLFEALPIGLAICDMDGQLTYVNQAYADIIGYTVDEALKLTYWEVTPKDYEEQEQEQLASLAKDGRYGPYEKEYIHKDGRRIPVRLSGVLIRENDQDMIWSSVENIAESKSANELAAKTALLEATFENMADGISMADSDLNMVAFNRRFLELLDFPPEKFHVGDPFESFIRYNAERGEYGPGDVEEQVRERVALAKQFKPHLFERTTSDGKVLEIRGQPLPGGGFVTLYSDISERKKAENDMLKSEAKFKDFAQVASDWFWEMDADLRFSYFSSRNKEITGFEPELYIGKTRREIGFGDADDEHWRRHIADIEARREFRDFEYDLKIASGKILTISISGNPVFDEDGVFQGYYGTGRDISQRKKAEQALMESETKFRKFAEVSSDWLWEMDADLRFTSVTDRYKEITGLEGVDVIGKNRQDMAFGGMEDEHWRQHLSDIEQHRTFRNFEYDLDIGNGRFMTLSISGNPIFDADGKFQGYYGTGRNISERMRAEKNLRESEQRFRALYHQSPLGVTLEDYSLVKRRIDKLIDEGVKDIGAYFREHEDELKMAVDEVLLLDANKTLLDMFGAQSFEEYKAYDDDFELWKDTNWREFYIDEFSAMAVGEHTFIEEFKDTKLDGTAIEIRCTTRVVRGREDDWSEIITTHEDVTARKTAEAALEKSEKFARSIVENEPQCVKILGPGGVLRYMNPAGLAMIEANDFEKVAGTSVYPIVMDEFKQAFQDLTDRVFEGERGELEFMIKGLKGTERWLETHAVPLFDAEGNVESLLGLTRDISDRKQSEEQLLQQATIDQVTGLPNRALLFDRLAQAIEHARRENRNVGLIFVDLDRFKQVNDTRGHAAGDQLLELVGERLSLLVRHEDTVARLGGDEFIVLLNDIELPNGPEIVALKILEEFTAPFEFNDSEIYITASLGISLFPADGEDPEILLQHADAAMYKSKRQGRNTFRFFTPGLNDQAEHHGRIAERLRHALDRGDFQLHFQPVVDVMKDNVAAVEALIRWDDAVLKDVDSGLLISIAEEAGFILPIDKWVLDEACRHVAAWRADIAPSLMLSVNVSRSNFRNPGLIDIVKGALENSNLPADALAIEITENVLIEDSAQIIERLNELTDMGVKLALDDFGTGYSSLAYLKKFRVQALKIDQTFIRDIATNSNDLSLVMAIIAMSHRLDLTVVAEGVETPAQLELLQASGCHLIQGFHFSHPLSVDEMTDYLNNEKIKARIG